MHTDTIVVTGMMLALLIIVFASVVIAVSQDDMKITDLGKEIIIGLFGFIGGGATQAMRNKDGGGSK